MFGNPIEDATRRSRWHSARPGGRCGRANRNIVMIVALAALAILVFIFILTSLTSVKDQDIRPAAPAKSASPKAKAPPKQAAAAVPTPKDTPAAATAAAAAAAQTPAVETHIAPDEQTRRIEPVQAELVRRLGPKPTPGKLVPGIRRSGPTNAPNPLAALRTTSERVMSQILRTRPGDPVIPVGLGMNFAQDFAASLTNEIVIYATDSEADAQHKESIGWMKDGMRQMVEQGESPEEIIMAYRSQLNELAAYRVGLQRQLNALKQAGDLEAAEAFVAEANAILAEYGARPLVLYPNIPAR